MCVFYLLVGPVLWLEVAARLLESQVEVGKSVEKVHPPRRRVAHHRRHGEQRSKDSTHWKTVEGKPSSETLKYFHGWKRENQCRSFTM